MTIFWSTAPEPWLEFTKKEQSPNSNVQLGASTIDAGSTIQGRGSVCPYTTLEPFPLNSSLQYAHSHMNFFQE